MKKIIGLIFTLTLFLYASSTWAQTRAQPKRQGRSVAVATTPQLPDTRGSNYTCNDQVCACTGSLTSDNCRALRIFGCAGDMKTVVRRGQETHYCPAKRNAKPTRSTTSAALKVPQAGNSKFSCEGNNEIGVCACSGTEDCDLLKLSNKCTSELASVGIGVKKCISDGAYKPGQKLPSLANRPRPNVEPDAYLCEYSSNGNGGLNVQCGCEGFDDCLTLINSKRCTSDLVTENDVGICDAQ